MKSQSTKSPNERTLKNDKKKYPNILPPQVYLFQWKEFGLTLASQQVCILISDYSQQNYLEEQQFFSALP